MLFLCRLSGEKSGFEEAVVGDGDALEKAERRRDELTKGAMERAQLQYDNIKSL